MITRFLQPLGKQLVVAASESTVRILDGNQAIAQHRRSYDRRQQILDPEHQEELKDKYKALGPTRGSRLSHAVPESEALLDAAFTRGESAGRQTTQLLNLLDLYGAAELQIAVREALDRNTPSASSVAFILNRPQRLSRRRLPIPVDLSRRPDLADLDVQPHNSEIYDDLFRKDDDSEQ